jgi:hypothetical protein
MIYPDFGQDELTKSIVSFIRFMNKEVLELNSRTWS